MDFIGVAIKVIAKLFCLAKGLNCAGTTAVLTPAGCGKSWISSNCISRNDALLLDLDSLSLLSLTKDQLEHLDKLKVAGNAQSVLLFLLPLFKEFLKNTRSKFKNRDIILFTSKPEVLDYLKTYINRRLVFCPSESFWNVILDKIESAQEKKDMTASRTSLVASFGKKVRIFNSWSDLGTQLSQELQITQRV